MKIKNMLLISFCYSFNLLSDAYICNLDYYEQPYAHESRASFRQTAIFSQEECALQKQIFEESRGPFKVILSCAQNILSIEVGQITHAYTHELSTNLNFQKSFIDKNYGLKINCQKRNIAYYF